MIMTPKAVNADWLMMWRPAVLRRDFDFMGFIPYDEKLIEADLEGISPFDTQGPAAQAVAAMMSRIEK